MKLREDLLPSLAAYVRRLPNGLESYPQCQAKASLYRSALSDRPLPAEVVAALPRPLRDLVQTPPPVSSWVSEVHSHSLFCALYDTSFASPEAFERFTYERQRELFGGPMYAILLRLASPTRLIKGATKRWAAFHVGSELHVEKAVAGEGVLELRHPPGLWDELSSRGLIAGFRAALELSGAEGLDLRVVESRSDAARFVARWNT